MRAAAAGGYILRYEHGKNKNNASVIGPLPSTGMQWLLRYPSKTEVLPGVVRGRRGAEHDRPCTKLSCSRTH